MPYGEEKRKERLLELGGRVRARREELGLSIEQVSERTKIRAKYLIAVEEGDDSVSPGKTYFRAFLKTYASFLGLDGAAFSNEYREIMEGAGASEPVKPRDQKPRPAASPQASREQAPPDRPKQPAAEVPAATGSVSEPPTGAGTAALTSATEGPAPKARQDTAPVASALDSAPPQDFETRPSRPRRRISGERRRKGGAIWVFLGLAAVAAVVFYFTVMRPTGVDDPGTVGGLPSEPGTPVVNPGNQEPAGEQPGSEPGEPQGDPEPPAPKVTREDPNKEKSVWSVEASPVELVVKLDSSEDSFCWVRVTVDGEQLFERTLTPGEEVSLTAQNEIVIRAGKPWVMHLTVNGQGMGVAGEFGPVKDLVFKAVVATP